MMKLYVNSYFILMKTLTIYFGQKNCLGGMQNTYTQLEWKMSILKIQNSTLLYYKGTFKVYAEIKYALNN